MARSTLTERAQRLNAAFELIALGYNINKAANALVEQFSLSRRQAYRYLQEAQAISHPVIVPTPIIPITLKISESMVVQLREYAQKSGLTMSQAVTQAISAFLTKARQHG